MDFQILLLDVDKLLILLKTAMDEGQGRLHQMFYDEYERLCERAKQYPEFLDSLLQDHEYKIYEDSGGYAASFQALVLSLEKIKDRIQTLKKFEEIRLVDSHFQDIQNYIINEIDTARYIIMIAVAWFTDIKIYRSLVRAKERGVNIQIITLNDPSNKDQNGRLRLPLDTFETYLSKDQYQHGSQNLHHKFCVIDLLRVITGSYNWTKSAKSNNEDVVILSDEGIAHKYADQFITMKSESNMYS